MSILSDLALDLVSLFAPRTCPVCGGELSRDAIAVCSMCEISAPLTNLWEQQDNAMTERFWGIIPVERAAALFWWIEGSQWRESVHRFKYAGAWLTAYNMGRWLGILMRQSGNFDNIDLVLPVPLHWLRRLQRGYNQSEYIARGIAAELGAKLDTRSLRRYRYNRTQTSQSATERWNNVEGIFRVARPERLKGRSVLIVDDVFTTGATIMSLGETILKTVPDCRLSVATLAVSRHSLRKKE